MDLAEALRSVKLVGGLSGIINKLGLVKSEFGV